MTAAGPVRVRERATLGPEHAGERLDQAVAGLWPQYSRSRLAAWIRAGDLTVDARCVKPNLRLRGGEEVMLETVLEPHGEPRPQPIPLEILHEDTAVLVIDKPAGLVVHPGSGNPDGTLVNALLHHDPALETLPRAGLIHRLDKDTSGCLLVARTLPSHTWLTRALKRRDIHRAYRALVWGEVIAGGRIEAPIGRHPVDRRRQVVADQGRPAVTHYRVARRLAGATLLDVLLETGRTHQIRVHMAHLGFPIIGDPVYGRRGAPAGLSEAQRRAWQTFSRQALHARRLEFPHPEGGRTVAAESPSPADMAGLVATLAADAG